ncbi:bifunctional acetate--CoA ligase family protein/GNAT family N-acetyltransferase [Rhodospira trueperi]|uniref:Acetyltransferase n=1 Tax=Rhodospira trueperi TaxID=69960 RepID=A0A1G6ZB51_9PROT|nr:bifunctional acetate--CoA ligase family protein/GNAT family N-acetyltransferase [Rhodospira trueperi]SDD99820.1 acetyltransferase [Rhodospira trueperi]
MSILGLSRVLTPRSVAVIGASARPRRFGNVVMRNLLEGNFPGPVMPVSPREKAVAGVLAYPSIAALPETPDLAVVCVAGRRVPETLEDLGARGTAGAIVVALDVDPAAIRTISRRHGLRVFGAGSLGLIVPQARLNASFAHVPALPGQVAFVSQSGVPCVSVLDWARPRGVGFSRFVSLGQAADVDFADMMDMLANDPETRAILLFIESIAARREFMPAARAAARNKPLLLVKAGRDDLNRQIGPFLSEALAAPDDVFDAAVGRAGALRVGSLDELFEGAETLARSRALRGDRLAVLANGEGALTMAWDEITHANGGRPATLSPDTRTRLEDIAVPGGIGDSAVDLGLAAAPERYGEALAVLAEDEGLDVVLVVHVPTPMADAVATARAVVEGTRRHGCPVLACWIGADASMPARRLLTEAALPVFASIRGAVAGFRHVVLHARNQDMLLETPPSDSADHQPDKEAARRLVQHGLADPDGLLTDAAARTLLAVYGVPTVPSVPATDAEDAARVAERMGFPVALTAASPDLPRKWDVGAVALNLENGDAVRAAAEGILQRVRQHRPDARVQGFAVQRMALRPNARQLMLGSACDPLFGPVLVFGEGGRAVEVLRDHVVGLPPLNLPLARQMIARTRVSRRLEAHGFRPAADREALAQALVRLSHLIVDNPEIVACDINPLFADEQGVLVVDARIRLAPVDGSDRRRFAIMPYPSGLEESATLYDGSAVTLRPIRPEDEPAHADLVARVTPQDLRYRFFGAVRELKHHQLARLTQVDYNREMAFIATRPRAADGQPETLGVVRTVTDPDNRRGELAILVRSDLKGTGLGTILVDKIVRYHRARGTGEIGAQVLADNEAMLRLAKRCGFSVGRTSDPEVMDCVIRTGGNAH